MRMLFTLCNSSERLIRLLHHCSDQGLKLSCSGQIQPHTNEAMASFHVAYGDDIILPMEDEPSCRGMQIYLSSEGMNLELMRMILEEEGEICESAEEAAVVVGSDEVVDELMHRHPRKLVISEAELARRLSGEAETDLLNPVANPFMPPPPLHDRLKPCWAKLRKRSIELIDEGLELFTALVNVDPVAGDPLLDQVSVTCGRLRLGKRFELTDTKTHPYSYYALLGILSRSPAGSRGAALRLGLEQLVDESEYEGPLSVITLPEIKGFANLKRISLEI